MPDTSGTKKGTQEAEESSDAKRAKTQDDAGGQHLLSDVSSPLELAAVAATMNEVTPVMESTEVATAAAAAAASAAAADLSPPPMDETVAAMAGTAVAKPLDAAQQAEIDAALEKVKEQALKQTPSISTLVTTGLWDDDPTKVEESLTEIANLSFGHEHAGPNRVTISLTGGLLAIVKAMSKHATDAAIQAAGGRALQNLSLDQNNKGGIASAGGIDVLVAAMKAFPDDVAVQMGGCGTFQNLVWGNDANRRRLLEAGAIPCVVEAMQRHVDEADLQEWACGSLFLLSVGEPEVKEAILANRGLSAIAKSIENHKDEGGIREKGRNALARLLWP